jgi:hypothetical protein
MHSRKTSKCKKTLGIREQSELTFLVVEERSLLSIKHVLLRTNYKIKYSTS